MVGKHFIKLVRAQKSLLFHEVYVNLHTGNP